MHSGSRARLASFLPVSAFPTALALATVHCLAVATAQANTTGGLSGEEIRQVLRHGPWPPQWGPDPSNRASGNPQAVKLGRALFFDTRLSASGSIACATCHQP